MEASALSHAGKVGLLGRSPALLRLQGDERLVDMIRGRNATAFEVLFDRYRGRLLSFCRGIVGSTEDAEDVLQEVFVAAHSAMLADERPLNLKPWLYRIARNRSLNHLRKPVADGQDTMDMLPHSNGASTADTVAGREELRAIFADVGELPETQRTALVLREIEDLSYEEIAQAMGTTLPSVKSLLVRARMSLAEASEGRVLTCDEVRLELAEAAEGLRKIAGGTRQHIRKCERCRRYRSELRSSTRELRALAPLGILIALRHFISAKLGGGAGSATAGSGGTAGGASAAGGAGAAGGSAGVGATGAAATGATGAAVSGSAIGTGGLIGGGALGAIGAKAAGGFATAAVLTASAVGVGHYAEQKAAQAPPPPAHYVSAAPAKAQPQFAALKPHHHARVSQATAAPTPPPVAATDAPPKATQPADTSDAPPTPADTPVPPGATDPAADDGATGSTTGGEVTNGDPTASGSSTGDDGTDDGGTMPPLDPPPPDGPPATDPPPTDPPPTDPPPPSEPPPPAAPVTGGPAAAGPISPAS